MIKPGTIGIVYPTEDDKTRFDRLLKEYNNKEFTEVTEINIKRIQYLREEIFRVLELHPEFGPIDMKQYWYPVIKVTEKYLFI